MLRLLREYSQEYMAQELNIGQNTYSKIENGKTALTKERLNYIAQILNVEAEMLENFDANRLIESANTHFKIDKLKVVLG